MRFGAFLAPFHDPRENPTLALERDLDLIVAMDRLGYDEVWVGEHHSTGWEYIAAPEIFLAVAAERGLAEVGDLSRGPREAIIACYAAMEEALASSPGAAPQDSDTPSEVLARAVGNRALRTSSATTLVEVFAEARFSRHVMTEDHREVAERALRAVLDELRQPAR